MEAFASSKAVVASRIGGIPEMVDDGVNGLLFPMGDADALAARLVRMLGDRRLREEMGRRGRRRPSGSTSARGTTHGSRRFIAT